MTLKKLMTVAMAVVVACGAMYAQPNSDRSLWKQAKKQAKEFKSEGWKVDGTKPLENLLYDHLVKMRDTEGATEIVGNAVGDTDIKTLNQGQQWALNNAASIYAKEQRQIIKGKVDQEVSAQLAAAGDQAQKSVDFFYEAFEHQVVAEIEGALQRSLSLYREKKNGGIDYRSYYLVDPQAGSKARQRAAQKAADEAGVARDRAQKISDLVK